jgi:hypothetical protein
MALVHGLLVENQALDFEENDNCTKGRVWQRKRILSLVLLS